MSRLRTFKFAAFPDLEGKYIMLSLFLLWITVGQDEDSFGFWILVQPWFYSYIYLISIRGFLVFPKLIKINLLYSCLVSRILFHIIFQASHSFINNKNTTSHHTYIQYTSAASYFVLHVGFESQHVVAESKVKIHLKN